MSEISAILRCWELGSCDLEHDGFRRSNGCNMDFACEAWTG